MEEKLYDAAVRGDTAALSQLLDEDPNLLDRALLKCEDKNVLHIGAMLGNEGFVGAVLRVNSCSSYQMCLARDRNGRNPLHLAAIHGHLSILNLVKDHHDVLIQAALEKADRGGTILHLCVQHNQLKALELLLHFFTDPEFASAKNEDGMTILHLAIYYNQNQARRHIITYLISNTKKIVNLKNANGRTALDLVLRQAGIELEAGEMSNSRQMLRAFVRRQSETHHEIARCLSKAKALTGREAISGRERHTTMQESLETRKDAIMVVASLIGTMAFQAMVSPPGGVWQEDSPEGPNPHRAGESVMAQTHPGYYRQLIGANTIAFVSSLSIIVVLIRGWSVPMRGLFFYLLSILMWLSVGAIAVAYGISLATVAPESARRRLSATSEIAIVVIAVWGVFLILWAFDAYKICRPLMRRRCSRFFKPRLPQ